MNYKAATISFSEIPMEGASLCIWVAGCGRRCKGCHSPQLRNHDGIPLTKSNLYKEILNGLPYITCVVFMGGENTPEVLELLRWIKKRFPSLKRALYAGSRNVEVDYKVNLNDLKLGEYREAQGGLRSPYTNQKFYEKVNGLWVDVTFRFHEGY